MRLLKLGEKPLVYNGPYRVDRDIILGTASRYVLDGPRFEHCWGRDFS
jgi:hypothetical protein